MINKPQFNINLKQAATYLEIDEQRIIPLIARGEIEAKHIKAVPGECKTRWLINLESCKKWKESA